MPTAARLVAAIAMAIVSAGMAILFVRVYTEEPWGNDLVDMLWTFGICGAWVGWSSLGKRAETDGGTGIVLGVRAAITTAVWILAVLSLNFMWGEIAAGRLAGRRPMEAIFIAVEKGGEYAVFILNPTILGVGLFAYICVGVMTRNTYFKWN